MSHVYERLPTGLPLVFKAFRFVSSVSVQIWPTIQLHREKTSRSVFICWLHQRGETDPTTTWHSESFAAGTRLTHQATMLASEWEPGAGPEKTQTQGHLQCSGVHDSSLLPHSHAQPILWLPGSICEMPLSDFHVDDSSFTLWQLRLCSPHLFIRESHIRGKHKTV